MATGGTQRGEFSSPNRAVDCDFRDVADLRSLSGGYEFVWIVSIRIRRHAEDSDIRIHMQSSDTRKHAYD